MLQGDLREVFAAEDQDISARGSRLSPQVLLDLHEGRRGNQPFRKAEQALLWLKLHLLQRVDQATQKGKYQFHSSRGEGQHRNGVQLEDLWNQQQYHQVQKRKLPHPKWALCRTKLLHAPVYRQTDRVDINRPAQRKNYAGDDRNICVP